MSSIAAVVANQRPGTGEVALMLSAAPHRGKIAELLTWGRVSLGCSRLEGEDATPAAVGSYGRFAALVIGDLDNIGSFQRHVSNPSRDPNDAEILAAAFEPLGEQVVPQLRGAFAAVVTDGSQVWCFRDQLGLEPLFYSEQPSGIYIASEAKQVVAGAGIASEPDIEVLERIFYDQLEEDDRCSLAGVRRLHKAILLHIEGTRMRFRRYWDPEDLLETARLSPEEVGERFDSVMERAVARVLRGNDALFLSGGIDSPAVAAYAAPLHEAMTGGKPLTAISATFPELPAVDESGYVRVVTESLGLPLHTYVPNAGGLDDLQTWVHLMDGPAPPLSAPEAAESHVIAAGLGFRRLLSGELAEFPAALQRHVLPYLVRRRPKSALRLLRQRHGDGMSATALTRDVVKAFVPLSAMRFYRRVHPLVPQSGPGWIDAKRLSANFAPRVRPADRWREEQISAFKGGTGVTMDACSMLEAAGGVRMRRPWADVDLWEFFLSLPAEIKFPGPRPKSLVVNLLRGRVPDPILDRRDKTFFDDFSMAHIDYSALNKWLVGPDVRISGVDYSLLADRLDRGDLTIGEYMWARDLAGVHAFLALW
ncbi:MAG: asparagine synthase-related protein [Actinomycetota bacterium]